MHKTAVIDASVIIKWFISKKEQGRKEARLLYRLLIDEQISLFAPQFLLVEILNILIKRHHVPRVKVKKFLSKLIHCGIHFEGMMSDDFDHLATIMTQHAISSYDGLYMLLSEKKKAPLITEDRQLLEIKDISMNCKEFLTALTST